eukprot:1832039-Prymnesium_polylepis.1
MNQAASARGHEPRREPEPGRVGVRLMLSSHIGHRDSRTMCSHVRARVPVRSPERTRETGRVVEVARGLGYRNPEFLEARSADTFILARTRV